MLVNQISWCANIFRHKEFRIISYILTQQYIGGNGMRLVDAVYARIVELANQEDKSFYKVARDGCVPYSTIVTMRRSSTVKLSTLYCVCDGLNITLKDFFDSPLFAKENISD